MQWRLRFHFSRNFARALTLKGVGFFLILHQVVEQMNEGSEVNVMVRSNNVRSDCAAGRGHALLLLGFRGSFGAEHARPSKERKERKHVLVDQADNNSNDERLDEGRHCAAFL